MSEKYILTNALQAYRSQQEAASEPIILDQFVFAYIEGLDPADEIDPGETLPAEENIVHRYDITDQDKGFLNPDSVVYSFILGTNIGDFQFNAMYLVNSETGMAAAIVHTETQTKIQNDYINNVIGDTIARSFVITFKNAQSLTEINVDASTWQLDFTARLRAMDERVRKTNLDNFGHAAFFGDSFQVVHAAGETSATVKTGVAYVGGLRCEITEDITVDLAGEELPTNIYLVSSFEGQTNSAWSTQIQFEVTESFPAQWLVNDVMFYSAPLATVSATEDAIDLRVANKEANFVTFDDVATIDKPGIVQLSSATDSDDETKAATPKAVKNAVSNIPDASLIQKGLVQLSSTINNADGVAATPKGVNTALQDPKRVPAAVNSSSSGSGFGGFRYTKSGTTLNLFTS